MMAARLISLLFSLSGEQSIRCLLWYVGDVFWIRFYSFLVVPKLTRAQQQPNGEWSLSPHLNMPRSTFSTFSTFNYTNNANQQISYAGLAIDHSSGVSFGTLFEEPFSPTLGMCSRTGKLFFLLITPIYLSLSFPAGDVSSYFIFPASSFLFYLFPEIPLADYHFFFYIVPLRVTSGLLLRPGFKRWNSWTPSRWVLPPLCDFRGPSSLSLRGSVSSLPRNSWYVEYIDVVGGRGGLFQGEKAS